MDELKVKVSSGLLKKLLAEIINKTVYKKLGYVIDVRIHAIEINVNDEIVDFRIDAGVETNVNEFRKLTKNMDLC